MKVKEISYSEARLISTAQFENARFEIGMTIEIGEGEMVGPAIDHAKMWVKAELTTRIMEMHEQVELDAKTEQQSRIKRKYKLT